MQYRMFLLISVLVAGMLGMVPAASAYYGTDSYNLERTAIRGYVISVENQVAYIQMDSGDEIAVQLGPESYWDENHYCLYDGEYVEMTVWYDPADLHTDCYFAGEIRGPDYFYRLTNDEGVPYWVLFADDYYYSLGYRSSCVSFMLWYDCPPVYFIYLILPPPPPHNYTCYYGQHWRTHYSDWQYGPRYGSGGSYWRDGRGYERSGHKFDRDSGNDPGRDNDNQGGNVTANYIERDARPISPATAPSPKPSLEPSQQSAQKWPEVNGRKVTAPHNKFHSKSISPVTTPTREIKASPSGEVSRQVQPQSKIVVKKDTGGSRAVRPMPVDNGNAQKIQVSRTPKTEKPIRDPQNQILKQSNR